ncbi:MAG: CBS domain-containing protein [Rhodocyclaceae bacterium]|nr:CBS domain-containing protein [Rhodocyclaceae bacterium]
MHRDSYLPLPQARMGDAHCQVADASRAERVSADTPAIEVMTDLRRVAAATIRPDTPLIEANQAMILRGVRSLFVLDADGTLLGVITATDLFGEAPIRLANQRGGVAADLTVRDVMTPLDRVEAVSLDDVLKSEVGHVAATLKRSGRQHLLVVQRAPDGSTLIRGLFSASQVARQLGVAMPTGLIASTFAEIEAALAA